jgi:hypothetical protein
VIIGLALFGLLISKIDSWIDKKERLGSGTIYKKKNDQQKKTD